jgi:hypothetical protein
MNPTYTPEPINTVNEGDTIPEIETESLVVQYIISCDELVSKTLKYGELSRKFVLEATADDWRKLRRYINSISPNSIMYKQRVQLLGNVFELFAEFGGSV